jgi:hypothetical protein
MGKEFPQNNITEIITDNILNLAKGRIQKETVLVIDLSDIKKEYAECMENLATVYNGSSGDTNSRGYWLLSVLGADVKGDELMPTYTTKSYIAITRFLKFWGNS